MNENPRKQTGFQEEHLGKQTITQPTVNTLQQLAPRCVFSFPKQLQTSFEGDIGFSHSQEIWSASIKYLEAALSDDFQRLKGLNSAQIFSCLFQHEEPENEVIYSIIQKNILFNYTLSAQFLLDVKTQPSLQKLLVELSKLFQQDVFHEICLVISQSWDLYLKERKKTALPTQIKNFIMPNYKNLDNLQDAKKNDFARLSREQVLLMANQVSEQIAAGHFLNPNLKFLNLKECELRKNSERIIRGEFSNFIETIVKSLFLCLEGEFTSATEEPILPMSLTYQFTSEFASQESELGNQPRKMNSNQRSI